MDAGVDSPVCCVGVKGVSFYPVNGGPQKIGKRRRRMDGESGGAGGDDSCV